MFEFKFPDEFLWGTATAAHQVEGYNSNTDWWEWENNKPPNRPWPLEPSKEACDSYKRYREDFDLAKQMNNNAIRFSIEWARLEPQKGKFDKSQFDYYREMIEEAKSRGLKTFVTLHHFVNPKWFANEGGWLNFKAPKYFERYAKEVAKELGEHADVFLTINEPQVLASIGYIAGFWPPGKHAPIQSILVQLNLRRAHVKAYDIMKPITPTPIGIVKNIMWFETNGESIFLDKILAKVLYYLNSDFFLKPIKNKMDLIGLNYYFTNRIVKLKRINPNDYLSDLQWWINPPGLEGILLDLRKYNLPIYITENGIADAEDKFRKQFIRDHLISCAHALEYGVNLKGYFYWSLIDNFEWHQGFWPRFGLVEIDRENNLERKPRESFYYYAQVCKNNRVNLSYEETV